MNDDVFITTIEANGHRFVFAWTHSTLADALRTLGRWAASPEIPLTWEHAATISRRMRQQLWEAREAEAETKQAS